MVSFVQWGTEMSMHLSLFYGCVCSFSATTTTSTMGSTQSMWLLWRTHGWSMFCISLPRDSRKEKARPSRTCQMRWRRTTSWVSRSPLVSVRWWWWGWGWQWWGWVRMSGECQEVHWWVWGGGGEVEVDHGEDEWWVSRSPLVSLRWWWWGWGWPWWGWVVSVKKSIGECEVVVRLRLKLAVARINIHALPLTALLICHIIV